MSRHRLALLSAVLVLPLLTGASAAVAREDDSPARQDYAGADHNQTDNRLAWMSTGTGIFTVDAAAGTVRYRGCETDTGRVDDPDMLVRHGVASGTVVSGGTRYRYAIPLRGRERGTVTISGPDAPTRRRSGEVVTDPQPPTDARRARNLQPLIGVLDDVVAKRTQSRWSHRPRPVRSLRRRPGRRQRGLPSEGSQCHQVVDPGRTAASHRLRPGEVHRRRPGGTVRCGRWHWRTAA
jgi:hypothetical protein